MKVVVPIPDELAARFSSEAELGRRAAEALALEEYRAGRLTYLELGGLLGLATDSAIDGFLSERGVGKNATSTEGGRRDGDDLVARFRAFAARHTLGGLHINELIAEGRR